MPVDGKKRGLRWGLVVAVALIVLGVVVSRKQILGHSEQEKHVHIPLEQPRHLSSEHRDARDLASESSLLGSLLSPMDPSNDDDPLPLDGPCSESRQKSVAALLAAFVSDAASMPWQWVYNTVSKERAGRKEEGEMRRRL